ncbi:MAG: hypothetical protein IPK02_02050 [Candidatus Accumulibacter sp.]|uniref:Uncharacterized protein n=1 Tax=Candidatus Accumulibacter affinis TaxID=2954384 RepID=A0A935W3A5_9PROT|nr:hypothetical protein [Candidatus Accumulibacter affinis]
MAKPNYQFEKRQRELEKKKKQEEKRLRDQAARTQNDSSPEPGATDVPPATDADAADPPA